MEPDKRKRIFNTFLSLLRHILNYAFFIIDKKVSIFYRKFYVWKILSSRGNWYLSRNGNLYNPIFQATVYPWNGEWNIARFNMHYGGFYSQEYAKKIAFQKWYREYKVNKLIDSVDCKVSKSFIKKISARPEIRFVFFVVLMYIFYNFSQIGSKFDKRSKEFDSIFNKNQKEFDSIFSPLKTEFNNEKVEFNNNHRIVDKKQDNPYDEEMKKHTKAMRERDENFSFLSNEQKESESFFREKYKEKEFDSMFNSLKKKLDNEKVEFNNSHRIVDKKQGNPYDEEMEKYTKAMRERVGKKLP